MRMNELTRYIDKYIDFDAIGEKIDALQDRLTKLREHLPEARSSIRDARKALPSYQQIRRNLPFAPAERSYTMPAAVAVGGLAILGAIVVTAYLMSDVSKRVPKSNEDMH